MQIVERDVNRVLTQLRHHIRERGFTQLEVQDMLGWGRSYISQLLTQQKSVRIEQILLILNVIGIDPAEFFGEVFQLGRLGSVPPSIPRRTAVALIDAPDGESMLADVRRTGLLLRGIVSVLVEKKLITLQALDAAVAGSASSFPDG